MFQLVNSKFVHKNCASKISRHLLARNYQTHNGVYGYKPRPKREFQIAHEVLAARNSQPNFFRLVSAFREHAHKQASINPISLSPIRPLKELELERFGLFNNDVVKTPGILHGPANECTVAEAIHFLEHVYCNSISAEFSYLENEEEREWFAEEMEETVPMDIPLEAKRAIAEEMIKSQAFDRFMASKFATVKRYGAEGAEAMVGFFQELFFLSARDEIKQIVLCMPHRGRLNLLTGMFNFPPAALFRKLKGQFEFPDSAQATGDVISHLTSTTDLDIMGQKLHLTMLFCPSHLEAVNPVAMGKTRARQQTVGDGGYSKENTRDWSDLVLNVQVHGDAAFAGQGINQETLNMTMLPHFEVGGTVHLVVNNQVGFTTPSDRGRSSRYCCDLAKMIQAPVIHVNGNDPEMVFKATQMAFRYQRQFRKDVFVDMNCFRRWGHNEVDDPSFTNPALYKIIDQQRSVPDLYVEKLEKVGVLNPGEATEISQKHYDWLNSQLKISDDYQPEATYLNGPWSTVSQADAAITTWDTGVSNDLLKFVGQKSVSLPEDFAIHPHLLKTHVHSRIRKLTEGKDIDWATAEAMAFGSLLYDGYDVRICGQDVGRGTFAQRHAMLIDQETNDTYIPLNDLSPEQKGHLEVANSILSEEAVLGFEYGMSIESPKRLAIWEAQFGDFFNGAQIQIDTFIASGETKWVMCSGLVMLLPHGYDGAGPEHSSCRLERFLQLSDSSEVKPDGDNVNMHIVNPTTPAQYFHLLRRQMLRNFRKPLIVAAPKTLLRLSAATSTLDEMGPGTCFKPVIGDNDVKGNNVSKVMFASGKHYYNLVSQRDTLDRKDVAIVRLECLCPFPTLELNKELEKYPKAKSFVWSQEEPRNQGAWNFVYPRFYNLVGRKLTYSGRPTLAAPAVGYGKAHKLQAEDVIASPFAP
ncbi:probable 2-oxoglutarate dehydrogenase E1 component DHKTD1 homolog, mitochondrial [Neocloeon triangulifer]|uniref:probable 2-oxoglutarate dehydrogenase E1 component DHKTD1 homolog, mitochondrial n=1 Tax=Neocloeon triangulifer TaxID=2078957 RepID=UPI00286F6B68|nr:probable 2-oxoglutarate dehydrogenase E1 component DHKTD1 homolog, mitochondrial [Neocloeon triangulifer]